MSSPEEFTRVARLLELVRDGDPSAGQDLLSLVYQELHGLAQNLMQRERKGHTLQPTALVHEAWLKMSGGDHAVSPTDREHFLAIAANAMRLVLVDHARRRHAQKRGGEREKVPLDDVVQLLERGPVDLLVFDETLERLAQTDAQLARIVELRFFAGLTLAETARVLDLTLRQIEYSWSLARAWLHREFSRTDDHAS